jgi:hypothetical protein
MIIKKLTIGVRPATKLFRLATDWGRIADALIASLPNKPLRDAKFFTGIGSLPYPPGGVQLRGDDGANVLTMTPEDIVFTRDSYRNDTASLSIDNVKEEFFSLWHIINSILKIQFVRRVGLVAEHRLFGIPNPSTFLLEKLTRYPPSDVPARFQMIFERRIPLPDGTTPDVLQSDFVNVIYSIYDASVDTERPADDAINFNLDVQRYYNPNLNGEAVPGELRRLKEMFDLRRHDFYRELQKLGVPQ